MQPSIKEKQNKGVKALSVFLISTVLYSHVFAQAPIITSFSPAFGSIGTTVTITGSNFSKNLAGNIVYFGGVKAVVNRASDTALAVTVPDGATPLPITVTTNHLTAYSLTSFIPTFPGGGLPLTTNSFAKGPDLTSDTANGPASIIAADLDGDGKPDLITSSYGIISPHTSVLLNTGTPGNRSFAAPLYLYSPNGSYSYNVKTGDIDGDGKLDLIVISWKNYTAYYLSIFKNTSTPGHISFASRVDIPLQYSPYGLAIRDLNGDGKPDLVMTDFANYTISVFSNMSTADTIAFHPGIQLQTNFFPHTVAIEDLDGDGKPDLAVTNSEPGTVGNTTTVSLFRNESSHDTTKFSAKTDIVVGPSLPFALAIGDLDGDGKADIVVSYSDNDSSTVASVSMSVLKNNSTPGVFSFTAVGSYGYGGGDAGNVFIGDLNGDGKPDIILPLAKNGFDIFQNTSTPGSISLGSPINYPSASAFDATISDLDGDNLPDMAVANFLNMFVSVFENTDTVPGIAAFSPVVADSGMTVIISGVNLAGATAVSFGGVPASTFTIESPGTIKAVVGAGASGNVVVTIPTGVLTLPGFTYAPVPLITSVSPDTVNPGTTVVITGSNFTGVSAVSFGGTPPASYTVTSPTTISAVAGAGETGDINVTTSTGTAIFQGFVVIGPPSIFVNGDTAICEGDSLMLISSTPINNQWYKNGVAINGANLDTLSVSSDGNYTVTTSFKGTVTAPSLGITVTVNPDPVKPAIQHGAVGMISSATVGNQWYIDTTEIISGATNQGYKPSDSGYFAVKVTQEGCSSVFSALFYYNLPSATDSTSTTNDVRAVPNPVTTGQMEVVYNFPGVASVMAELSDLSGQVILKQPDLHSGDYINLSGIMKGMYILKLFGPNGKSYSTTSIIKL